MTELLLIGDTHGQAHDLKRRVEQHSLVDYIVQVGDFGFIWPGHDITHISNWFVEREKILWWLPGNHEGYEELRKMGALDATEPFEVAPNIFYLPRGYRWEWDGVTFAALGGAVSIDQYHRKVGVSWWPAEEITNADVEKALTLEPVDVVLCHDAPLGMVPNLEKTLGGGLEFFCPPEHRSYLQRTMDNTREALRIMIEHLHPSLVVHGHFHRYYRQEGIPTIIGLNKADEAKSTLVLRLSDGKWTELV